MIVQAVCDATGKLVTVAEAEALPRGERYSHPETGERLRFHRSKTGKPQPHFEREPRERNK